MSDGERDDDGHPADADAPTDIVQAVADFVDDLVDDLEPGPAD